MLALFAALALDPFFTAPTLAGAHSGALVVAADSGTVLYSRNADDAFIPASTMKLLVGSAALDVLGNAFSFSTTLATDGTNLYLRGGGDPLLTEDDLLSAATALQSLDQLEFGGALLGDVSRYSGSPYPDGWQIDDLPYDYAAPASAIGSDENTVHIRVRPGGSPGAPTVLDVTPASARAEIDDRATTGAAHSTDTTGIRLSWHGERRLIVTGSVPLDMTSGATLDGAMLDPASITIQRFAQSFDTHGIRLAHEGGFAVTPPDARVLWQHRSPALPALLARMWQPSDNLLAESLLDEIGVASGDAGTTRAAGIAREIAWLRSIGVDPDTLTIVDGSGMSAYDRMTPRALVAILAHDLASGARDVVFQALPVAGTRGTLAHTFSGSPLVGRVFAKTGTSNHTRTLAGYVQGERGPVIFALMINDWMDTATGADERLRAAQQRFLEAVLASSASDRHYR